MEEETVVVVAAFLTTCDKVFEGLAVKLPSAFVYTAVIECVATVSEVVVNVATPEPLSVWAEPRGEPPSMNWTLPVGVAELPDEALLTAAVKVTDWPKNEGLLLDVTAVEVVALVTVSVCVLLVLAA